MGGGYHLELHISDIQASKYSMFIGSMNWTITLGKMDVMFEANILAKYSCAPCHKHLKTASRVFGYLKFHPKVAIKFDTQISDNTDDKKWNKGWKYLYPHAKEKIPQDVPTPKGRGLKIIVEVNAFYANDLETRRSVARI